MKYIFLREIFSMPKQFRKNLNKIMKTDRELRFTLTLHIYDNYSELVERDQDREIEKLKMRFIITIIKSRRCTRISNMFFANYEKSQLLSVTIDFFNGFSCTKHEGHGNMLS